ncbi:MAG: hypothetical protein HY549_09230 [Elusimicrobia bacterium]|nr:hypothetical protein [Elusimicrobiota bacterium]
MRSRPLSSSSSCRYVSEDCEIPREASEADIAVLLTAGYMEITEEEKERVERKICCTERQMLCEFTLQIRDVKDKKGRPLRRYFLFCKGSCDPLMVIVGAYRKRIKDESTAFFGMGGPPTCYKP